MRTIRARLLVTFGVVILVTAGVTLIVQTAWLRTYLVEDKTSLLTSQSASISQFTAVYVRQSENLPAVAGSLLQQFSTFSSGDLALYDRRGHLLESTGRTSGYAAAGRLDVSGSGGWPSRRIYTRDGTRWLAISTPIGQPAVGYVTQTVSLGEVDLALAASQRRLVFASLLALLGAGVVSLFLSGTLTRPVLGLRDTALALASGDLSVRVQSDRQDELGELSRSIDHMANRLDDMLASSNAERRRLSAIMTNLSEGLVALDGQDRVLIANPAAALLFHCMGGDMLGRDAAELLPGGRMRPVIQAARTSGGLYAHELEWPYEDGTTIRLTFAPFEMESGPGLVMTLRNITDLRRLEERRQEYISRLSHELRTPLTIIKGYLITLLDTPAQDLPSERGVLDTLNQETDRLARMVEELLEVSRQRSAVLRLKMAPERVDDIIRESVAGMRTQASRHGVRMAANLPDSTPPVPASRDHVKQVLLNLLDNAIKYNRSGGSVDVSLEVLPTGVSVTVRDTGRGIPPEDLPFIFDRYFRGTGHSAGGSGLGLSIVKEIIDAHGGEITVASGPEGTTVRFVLPRFNES